MSRKQQGAKPNKNAREESEGDYEAEESVEDEEIEDDGIVHYIQVKNPAFTPPLISQNILNIETTFLINPQTQKMKRKKRKKKRKRIKSRKGKEIKRKRNKRRKKRNWKREKRKRKSHKKTIPWMTTNSSSQIRKVPNS